MGSTTTTANAWILPIPNSRTTRETSLPLLGSFTTFATASACCSPLVRLGSALNQDGGRAAATSRPLATSALQRAASASQRAAASQLAVSSSSLPMRRHLHRRCDYDCRPWRSSPSSLVVKLVSLSSSASTSVAIVFVVLSRRSVAIAIVVNFVARRAVAIVVRTLTTNPPTGVPTAHIVQFRYGTLTTTIPELEEPGNGNETTVIDSSSGKGPSE